MSIFKSTFHPFIQGQILRRQELVSSQTRSNEELKWLASKAAWVRLTSCTNVTNANPELRKYFGITNNDDELARRYILMGGTLYTNPNNQNQTALRSGINQGTSTSKAYGSLGSNEFGQRPMPGITSFDIQSKSAYGSLRVAHVKINCWNLKQLEELEALYLKPGYSALIEWGWSIYPDNNNTSISTNNSYIDVFKTGLTQPVIYKESEKLVEKSYGNYDAFYGMVQNFEFSSRDDGGYDVMIEMVSIGEVIPSLTINSPQDNKDYTNTKDDSTSTNDTIYVDDYSNQTSRLGKLLINFVKKVVDNNGEESFKRQCNGKDKTHIDFGVYDSNFQNSDSSTKSKYISWGALAELINNKILPKDQTSNNIGYIDTTYDGTFEDVCTTAPICLSIDPSVCLVRTIVPISFKSSQGEVGVVQAPGAGSTEINPLGWIGSNTFFTATNPKYLNTFGRINNIYINIDYVLRLLLPTDGKNATQPLSVVDFIDILFSEIGVALGNVNKFKVFEKDNKIQVIDLKYIQESKDEVQKKLKLRYNDKEDFLYLNGSNSTARTYKLTTTIFPEQAAMIAIAAQAIGYTSNNKDVSTWQLINKGLIDRILANKVDDTTATTESAEDRIKNAREIITLGFDSVKVLADYINRMQTFGNVEQQKIPQYSAALDFLNNTYWPQKLITKNKLQSNQVSQLFNDVLPIRISISFDGISGFVIGQCFCIDPTLLPRSYKLTSTRPKIAFTVVDIKHQIQNNDWVTTIEGYMILIDAVETYNQK
jgi:hypothetical protein